MIKRFGLWIMMAAAIAVMCVPANATALVMLTLDPAAGALAAQAGTAIGWGYTITTDNGFVTIQSISFGDATPIGAFSTPGVPLTAASVGSPIISPWFVNISGLQYDIAPSAVLGALTQGLMTLTYDTYSDAGLTDQIGFGDTVNAQNAGLDVLAEVSVNAEATASVPEPGAMALAGLGCLVLALRRRVIG